MAGDQGELSGRRRGSPDHPGDRPSAFQLLHDVPSRQRRSGPRRPGQFRRARHTFGLPVTIAASRPSARRRIDGGIRDSFSQHLV
ncbi:hypothetical protein ACFFX0_31450 [Citricoccus parietis]|uniref:Uncharacterized protein n=1 Tax=Citricoccus parietis TaxID=592307 RepID=A0ABV5G927_9MICC